MRLMRLVSRSLTDDGSVTMSLSFQFHFEKTLQLAGYLLNLAGGRMNYMRLLKLLYIADREYLAEEGEMITGDRVFAMPKGPVLSSVYNLIQGKDSQSAQWSRFIKKGRNYTVYLVDDPGTDELCRAEKEKIENVFQRYGALHEFTVVELTHTFPEWSENYRIDSEKKSFPISPEDILKAQGRESMISVAAELIAMDQYEENLFGAAR